MIFVDVETTGVNPQKNSIVSIGAVDFDNPSNRFYGECRIWDGAVITGQALEINGFTVEEITSSYKQPLEELIKLFFLWTESIKMKTLAGENPSFDRDFLMESAKRYNLEWVFGIRTIDLHSTGYNHHVARGLEPPISKNRSDLDLNKILVYVGLSEEPNPHNALTGALMEAEAYSRLIYGKNLLPEYSKFEIPEYLRNDHL